MTHGIRWLNHLALTGMFAMMAVLLGCGVAPASLSDEGSATSTGISVVESVEVQPSQASWRSPADADTSAQRMMNPSPREGDTPSAAGNIDADAIVAAFEKVIGDVHESVLPSVVSVSVLNRVEVPNSFQGFGSPFPFGQRSPQSGDSQQEFFYSNGQGSGFVWDDKGHVVTNRHVVIDAERILVTFSDGSELEAKVVGMDAGSDLAALKVERDTEMLNPATLGNSNEVRVGQLAITIGNPFGQEFTTTTGIISAIGRTIRSRDSLFSMPKVIQTDAPMNPGNSGGPLLDRQGRVIGIDAQIITRSGANTGIGFAIPINIAKQVVPALISEGSFTYSWLGIRGADISAEAAELMNAPPGTRGAQVIALVDDSPAERAGLVGSGKTKRTDEGNIRYGGDVITAINGATVTNMNDIIIYLMENTRPGDIVNLSVVRDGGESAQIEVTLEARPQSLN